MATYLGYEVLTEAGMRTVVRWVASRCLDVGGGKDLWNVGELLPDYKALQPRRQPSSSAIEAFPLQKYARPSMLEFCSGYVRKQHGVRVTYNCFRCLQEIYVRKRIIYANRKCKMITRRLTQSSWTLELCGNMFTRPITTVDNTRKCPRWSYGH
jgi:hypothetical protein